MFLRGLVVCLLLATTSLYSQGSLTIVAPAAPGGGWDQTARVMQRVLAEIEPAVSVQVDNIPGAAGTIGLARFVQSELGGQVTAAVSGYGEFVGQIAAGQLRALAISHGDWSVFVTRPLAATLLAIAATVVGWGLSQRRTRYRS